MKTYEIITQEILTKTFRLDANSEEEVWEMTSTPILGMSDVKGVRLIKEERYDWHEQKEVNEVEGE